MNRRTYLREKVNRQVPAEEREPAMEIVSARPSAKILMFPLAARMSASNLGAKDKFAAELASLRNTHADFDGWYHEAAVEEENQQRKS
jgi:hypothetical protein